MGPEALAGIDARFGHPLTGPFYVDGAKAGDCLEVVIEEIQPDSFGWTCIIPGLGLLADRFREPALVLWDLVDGRATSPSLPGVSIPAAPFLGVIGVAPSPERLRSIVSREGLLAAQGAMVFVPDRDGAVPAVDEVATSGLRTIPPREIGGNMDVKQMGAGARVRFMCDVDGALVSLGDPHFAQGDGESCGVAIEMSARAVVRFELVPAEELVWAPNYPAYEFVEPERGERRYIATTGIPVTDSGDNRDRDIYLAAQVAFSQLVDYLAVVYELTPEAAYIVASVAADLRISSIVNVPNPVVSAMIPIDVFREKQER
jgi:formamidase